MKKHFSKKVEIQKKQLTEILPKIKIVISQRETL